MYKCHICEKINKKKICRHCGVRIIVDGAMSPKSSKSASFAISLAWLGYICIAGLHRLYLGHKLSGLIMFSAGLLASIGWLLELVSGSLSIMFILMIWGWTGFDLSRLWDNDLPDSNGNYLKEHGDMS